ncbi:MAG: methyltransferase domain-containing protein [Actinomycetota bacterium]
MQAQLQISKSETYPENLLLSLREVQFVCPLCRGGLTILTDGYACKVCQKNYLLHDGIPDFRVFPDPYLNFEEDYKRTEIVLDGLEKYDLEKLLEYYWSFSDITPEDLRAKFIRSVMLGEQRAKRTLEIFENGSFKKTVAVKKVLEIGSGTGDFLAVAGEHYEQVIGTDIAMRWLHVSRRRFMDKGLPVPPLVCCCAEYLPFADDNFDLVVMTSTLEFVKDQAKVLSEGARVLTADGVLYINSVNRYSLATDPYSYLWGVGFLPRAWQAKYVLWRRDAIYKTRTLSYPEFNRLAGREFPKREFALPDVSAAALEQFSAFTRLQVYFYRFFKKLPVFSLLLKQIGPGWDVILRKNQVEE